MRRRSALRFTVLLACALLLAVGVTAAPAPVYRPKPPVAWVTGWEKPVDPFGDCRFDKKGDKLRIFVPCGGHGFRDSVERTSAPHLLREIEGDFDVQVRVAGDFTGADPNNGANSRGAGIAIEDGTNFLRFGRGWNQCDNLSLHVTMRDRSGAIGGSEAGSSLEPIFLRMERRKNVLKVKYRTARPEWTTPFSVALGHAPWVVPLPKKLKVGVFAESMAPGVFEPVFDQFELTPAK